VTVAIFSRLLPCALAHGCKINLGDTEFILVGGEAMKESRLGKGETLSHEIVLAAWVWNKTGNISSRVGKVELP